VIPGAFFAELCVTASTTAHPEGFETSYPGNNLYILAWHKDVRLKQYIMLIYKLL
jgi:hypothetical protein